MRRSWPGRARPFAPGISQPPVFGAFAPCAVCICPLHLLSPKRHRPGRDGVAAIPGAGEEKEGSRHIPEAYSRRHFARAI